ncbi:HAMP domain-containing histidine kinase [bacterium]|nr:HAMP domain-containing histidine kinase [bacterium]
MKLNTNMVRIISAVIFCALAGLIWVEVTLLRRAYTLELRSFEHNVNSALSSVVQEVENHALLSTMVEMYLEDGDRAMTLDRILGRNLAPKDTAAFSVYRIRNTMTVRADSMHRVTGDSLRVSYAAVPGHLDAKGLAGIAVDGRELGIHLDEPAHVTVLVTDSSGREVQELVNTNKERGSHAFTLGPEANEQSGGFLKVIIDTTVGYFRPLTELSAEPRVRPGKNVRKMFISTVSSAFDSTGAPGLSERIDPAFLDSVLTVTLQDAGLPEDVHYAVYSQPRDSLILRKPLSLSPSIRESAFKARLFSFTLSQSRYTLYLQFPGKRLFLMKQLIGIAATALLFILMLGGAFIFIITMMLGQKRFSQSLVDFINNMTHEFKTPISTISLVSETMIKPEVIKDRKRLEKYSRVIRDENMRMRGQVNKILQMAELEQGEIGLRQDRIDMHALITTAAGNFTIQAENRKGEITLSLAADRFTIYGDRDHLMNILSNLLDNGLKYNTNAPRLTVATRDAGSSLVITVSDNGIGIAPEHIRRVFEKYYRVPTGNLHDVKGFGLGLSYVKLMVEAHGGSIRVESRPAKGAQFTITLPAAHDE